MTTTRGRYAARDEQWLPEPGCQCLFVDDPESHVCPPPLLLHLGGVPWHDAPIPQRLHRCKAQTRGTLDSGTVERCACGALQFADDPGWIEKNSRHGKRGPLRKWLPYAVATLALFAVLTWVVACGSQTYYRDCDEARQAGAAPLHDGDPGYSVRLDRDRDGVACG